MGEEAMKCPICGEELLETKEGLKCINQEHHRRVSEFKAIFSGAWMNYENIETSVRYERKDVTENPPTCQSCGTVIDAKKLKNAIKGRGVGYRAFHANRSGEYSQKLTELYNKIRKKQLNLEEAFEQELLLNDTYVPKTAQERFVAATSGNVPIDCPKCKKRVGVIEVTVKAKPEARPKPPTCAEYMALELTPEQERIAKEHFHFKDTVNEWLEGKDIQSFIEKLEAFKTEISTLPYILSVLRELNNLRSSVYMVAEKVQRDLQTRPDQLFMLLKEPPLPRVSPTAELLEKEKREAQRKHKIRGKSSLFTIRR